MGYPLRNEKYLAAMAAGKWILHRSYLEACRAEGHFIPVSTLPATKACPHTQCSYQRSIKSTLIEPNSADFLLFFFFFALKHDVLNTSLKALYLYKSLQISLRCVELISLRMQIIRECHGT